MFARLRALFSFGGDEPTPKRRLQLAAAAVLVETAMLDGRLDAVERRRIAEMLAGHFRLSAAEAEALFEQARRAADDAVELAGFARTVKDGFDHDDRVRLIEMLWEVAYADGHVHEYEANLARRIAGLIHVPDQDAGAARKRVMARLGIE